MRHGSPSEPPGAGAASPPSGPPSLAELVDRGGPDLAHYLERPRPPASPLEWIGIGVARIPELAAHARTADDLSGHSRPGAAGFRAPLLDALAQDLAVAAATVDHARRRLVERHPDADPGDGGVEAYAELVEVAQRPALRRAEAMIGAYASFLGAAVEASGGLADAQSAAGHAPAQSAGAYGYPTRVHAGQLHTALTNALGGLLAYARLLTADAARLRG